MDIETWNRTLKKKFIEEQFVKINNDAYAYYHEKSAKYSDTLLGDWYKYKGKVFDRFPVFKGLLSTFVIYDFDYNEIQLLIYNGDNTSRFVLTEFKPNIKTNSLLFGSWKKVNIGIKNNLHAFSDLVNSDTTNLSLKNKIQKIKKEYNMDIINITNKGLLQRYFRNDSNTVKNHKIDFGLTNKYLFVKNFHKDSSLEIFEIKKLTKDSLVLKIYDSKILYKFTRLPDYPIARTYSPCLNKTETSISNYTRFFMNMLF
jgi:hypothetical protein